MFIAVPMPYPTPPSRGEVFYDDVNDHFIKIWDRGTSCEYRDVMAVKDMPLGPLRDYLADFAVRHGRVYVTEDDRRDPPKPRQTKKLLLLL